MFAVPLFVALSWGLTSLMAIPTWLLWTVCGLGSRYFDFLPVAWQSISLMNLLGLFWLFAVLRSTLKGAEFSLKVNQ